jgi:hypothetical protein
MLCVDRSVREAMHSGDLRFRICLDDLDFVIGIGELLALIDDDGWRLEGIVVLIEVEGDRARWMLLEAVPMPGSDEIAAIRGEVHDDGFWRPYG